MSIDLEPPVHQLTPEAMRVYADAVLERGDVHGEFIQLQCERARTGLVTAREAELQKQMDAHVESLLGCAFTPGWTLGLLTEATVEADHLMAAHLEALSDWIPARALRRLKVLGGSHTASLQPLMESAPRLRFDVLQHLTVDDGLGWGGPMRELEVSIGNLEPLCRRWPGLRVLELTGLIGDVGALDFPQLERFSAATLDGNAIGWLVNARWPKLRSLTLTFYDTAEQAEPVFGALLDSPISPALEAVHITSPWPDFFRAALPRSRLGRGRQLQVD